MSEDAPQAHDESQRIEDPEKAHVMADAEDLLRTGAAIERQNADRSQAEGRLDDAAKELEIANGLDAHADREGDIAGMHYDAEHHPETETTPAQIAESQTAGKTAEGLPTDLDEFMDLYKTIASKDYETSEIIENETWEDEEWRQQHPETYVKIVQNLAEDSRVPMRIEAARQIKNIIKLDKEVAFTLLKQFAADEEEDLRGYLSDELETLMPDILSDQGLEEALPFLRIYAEHLKKEEQSPPTQP